VLPAKPTPRSLDSDTIAAIATAPGKGGIGVVRLSGPKAYAIGLKITQRQQLQPRYAHYADFFCRENESLDNGLVLFFEAPHSFTGEHVVELQGHGGPVVLQMILNRCTELGARRARPGEFSERAFLNEKLDLLQAEAIADLINAQTQTAVRQAQASLRGRFSQEIDQFARSVLALRLYIEAAIDFPEEEIDFLAEGHVAEQLLALVDQGNTLLLQARRGQLIQGGASIVLVGEPNAGKSSLMNALVGNDSSIVTDIPGTTRDLVKDMMDLGGVPVSITDTAGLRDSDDPIESEGVKRALAEIERADLTVWVCDELAQPGQALSQPTNAQLKVITKCDLSGRTPGNVNDKVAMPTVAISSVTGEGLDDLKTSLLAQLGLHDSEDTLFSARERHIEALHKTQALLQTGLENFNQTGAGELLAEDLKVAHQSLGSITGEVTSDDLLGHIFSQFCIGK